MNKLYILCGIPFSGKSSFAAKLVKMCGFIRIDLDQVKFNLFGPDITDEDLNQASWDKIYTAMYKRIEENLKKGETVIQDAGNFTRKERALVRKIANKLEIPISTIYINIPTAVAKARLLKNRETKERFDVSDEDFNAAIAEMELPTKEENPLTFFSQDSVEEWVKKYIS